VKPVPRYAELLGKRGTDLSRIDLARVQEAFSAQDLLDLQVHFMLAWMGFAARREHPVIAGLLRKERGFTDAEKTQLLDASRDIAQLAKNVGAGQGGVPALLQRMNQILVSLQGVTQDLAKATHAT